ncbi:MAG: HD domain-containing protein [Nanoarchaeota archaeon]|nr:HD domain-containing protein [Nanoarchaeota archaeon]
MDEKAFLDLCLKQGYAEHSIAQFQKALAYSYPSSSVKKRLSGGTFFDHYLRAAAILVENISSPEIVTAVLLQGAGSGTEKSGQEKEITEIFGNEIANLLKGTARLKEIKYKNNQLEAEALHKIILTTLDDVRVIVIKLANKLDNIRDIEALPLQEQQRIAQEVLEVYAPLASRLGVERIKNQLEDEAFKILHPQQYKEICAFVEESNEQRENSVVSAIALIKDVAAKTVDITAIKGRSKHIYSIYKKIVNRGVTLHEMYDFLGIRVIVGNVKDCYILLGLLHEKLEPIENKLKDYIANPKPNFYRSLHTAVKLPDGKIAEVQIRTEEMDEFAEGGIAAHWRYKGVKSEDSFEKKMSWLRSILDLQKDNSTTGFTKEFLETLKVDIFGDTIYCYTPKGAVKELPQGATLLDFAYLVHEEIGNHAVGGRVNGTFVPLKHPLAAGDVVEIVTNKQQRPRRSWLKFVTSGKTKQKIRKSLKEYEKLPALHYRLLKPAVKEEEGVLVGADEFPAALCIFAKCCLALPGNEITGIFTKRRVISVHRQDCRAAIKEEERWTSVHWRETFNQKIRFFVTADERSGILADLLHTIATVGFEVKEAKAKLLGAGNAECSFLVIPRDLEQVKMLLARVENVKGVKKIYFE